MPFDKFKRIIIVATIIPLGFFQGSTQNILSGQVKDIDGNGLIGANIFLPNLKTGTTSDSDGYYEITNLPTREMLVQISYVGFITTSEKITISGRVERDFILQETHIEAREVIITGLSITQQKQRSPVAIDILKRDFLTKSRGSNLIDALTKIPGISAIASGPGISKPVIRGLGYNRVLVVNDGIRQEGQQWGDEHGIEIDGYSVDRVEIFRGPASLMYGSDGLGGVINIESPHPPQDNVLKGSFSTAYHTNNQQKEYSGFLSGSKAGWSGYLRSTYRHAEDYNNAYDGEVFNSGFEEKSLSGMAGITQQWGYSHIHFSLFHQEPQIPEGERDAEGHFLKDDSPFQKIDHRKISWNNNFILDNSSIRLVMGYQNNLRKEFEEIDHASLFFDMGTFTYDLKYFLYEKNGWEYTFGLSGMIQNSSNKGLEFLVPDYHLDDEGAFVYSRKVLGDFEFSAGLRIDHRDIQGEELIVNGQNRFSSFSNDYSNLSGSVGVNWLILPNSVIKINLARGFRTPNIAELASNGIHEGTFRYEIGTNSLEAETNWEVDAGFEMNRPHVSLSFNTFFNQIDNYIFLEKLAGGSGGDSITIIDGEGFPTFQFTQGKARLYGGEVSIDMHPHPYDWLHFKNTFALVLARQVNNANQFLPFIPAPKLQSEIRAQISKVSQTVGNLFIETDLDIYLAQNRILSANQFESPAASYFLWNAGMGFDWTNRQGKKKASLLLSVENLLDKAYQNHLNRLKYAPENPLTRRRGIFNMGRSIVLKLSLPFL